MSSGTKIIVLKMKEILYTVIFIFLAILLAILFYFMFRPEKNKTERSDIPDSPVYVPGVYCESVTLGSHQVNVTAIIDRDRIHSVFASPLDESVPVLYPLVEPALSDLADQIIKNQSAENLSYPAESRYTSEVLIMAVKAAVKKAVAQ